MFSEAPEIKNLVPNEKFRSDPSAIIFDFDGVILESTGIKDDTFRAMFADETDAHQAAILKLHRANGGVSRNWKFEKIFQDILARPLTITHRDRLALRFRTLVMDRILDCPFVPGALEFLEAHKNRTIMVIASGTPENELLEIVEHRGIAAYFDKVKGAPDTKTAIIRKLLDHLGLAPENCLCVGDSMTDYEAATENRIPFMGRVMEDGIGPFPPDIPVIKDLRGLQRILEPC